MPLLLGCTVAPKLRDCVQFILEVGGGGGEGGSEAHICSIFKINFKMASNDTTTVTFVLSVTTSQILRTHRL